MTYGNISRPLAGAPLQKVKTSLWIRYYNTFSLWKISFWKKQKLFL